MHPSSPDPANLTGIDYDAVPPLPIPNPIIDAHCHIRACPQTVMFFEIGTQYGVGRWVAMTPLADVPEIRRLSGDRVIFNAIPDWKSYKNDLSFRDRWLDDLTGFRELGSPLCKFWMAPKMRKEEGLTLDHPFMRPVIRRAMDLGYFFMVHVGDPSLWWNPGGKYFAKGGHGSPLSEGRGDRSGAPGGSPAGAPAMGAGKTTSTNAAQGSAPSRKLKPAAREERDRADLRGTYGSKADQYPQLDWFLKEVHPRPVIAAHLGGSAEEPDRLRRLLSDHENLCLDTSAAKWIIREVSRRPAEIRRLILDFPNRILFGSDLVVTEAYTTRSHYASRYWALRRLWETPYNGLSPIADPDAEAEPKLRGVDLPKEVLGKVYRGNAEQWGL